MSATSHRRATSEIVLALRARVEALKLPSLDQTQPEPAFQRVEVFDSEDLVEAFRELLVHEQRVCVIVVMDEEFTEVIEQRKLIVKRVLPVALLISDRVLGDRKVALWGDVKEGLQGAMGLMELTLPTVIGLLLPNPAGVMSVPVRASVMRVVDTEKELPGRVAVALELSCRGGWLEAQFGPGPVL